MIGNNSAGAHSLTYGKTLDHVLELTVLLSDGSEVVLKDVSAESFETKSKVDTLEGRAYREIASLARDHRNEILSRYPKIMRRVSGYNLDEFVKPQPFNLARILVGSEGTLATVVEAKMRLVPKPKWTAMDVIHFYSDQEALECSQVILQTAPYAMESTDRMILDLARGNIEQSRKLGFVQGNPNSLLMVEYAGETEGEVKEQVYKLEALRKERADRLCRQPGIQAGRGESDLGSKKSRTGIASRDEGGQKADCVRRGHRRRAGEASRVHQTFQSDHRRPRRDRRLLWPLFRWLYAYSPADQPQGTQRDEQNGLDCERDLRSRP